MGQLQSCKRIHMRTHTCLTSLPVLMPLKLTEFGCNTFICFLVEHSAAALGLFGAEACFDSGANKKNN